MNLPKKIDTTADLSDPSKTLKTLLKMEKAMFSPAQKGAAKALEESYYDWTKEALSSNQPGMREKVESDMGLNHKQVVSELIKNVPPERMAQEDPKQLLSALVQNPQILQPKGLFTSQGVTPEGNVQLGGKLAMGGMSLEKIRLLQQIAGGGMESRAEERRWEGEERRQRQLSLDTLRTYGGKFNKKELTNLSEIGLDADTMIQSGRASRTPDGGIEVIDSERYKRLVEEGKFTPEEQKHIRNNAEEINTWGRVIRRMDEIGVKEGANPFEVVFEKTNDPILRELGIVSIPARFEVVRQFADDPRYQAVARDIELAFQKFRTRVTGAQASDKEIERLRRIMAKLTDQPKVFFQTIRNFMENGQEDFDSLLEIKKSFGRDTSQFEGLLEKMPSAKQVGIKKGQSGETTQSLTKSGFRVIGVKK